TARMLMTVPLTIWSTRKEIERMAWMEAISTPARIAAATPSQRLWLAKATAKPTKAPVSMMPSRAMLVTPDRSHMTPPKAASASGVAVTSVCEPKTVTSLAWIASSNTGDGLALGDGDLGDLAFAEPEQPADDGGRGDEDDHRGLHDRDQVRGHLRLQLHEAGPVVERAEQHRGRKDRPGVAAGEQRDRDRVKPVAGGDGRRHDVLDAEGLHDPRR